MTYPKLTHAMLSLTDGDPTAIPATSVTTLERPPVMEENARLPYPRWGAGREPGSCAQVDHPAG